MQQRVKTGVPSPELLRDPTGHAGRGRGSKGKYWKHLVCDATQRE